MGRIVRITCDGNTVCDSRTYTYGITEGRLTLGIDENIPELEFTVSPKQAGYSACVLGGDVKVYFNETLKFRGRLDEIDTDAAGNRTVVAHGDIARLNDIFFNFNIEDGWRLDTVVNSVMENYNYWVATGAPFKADISIHKTATYTDTSFSIGSETGLGGIQTAIDAFSDGSVHYWVEPEEGDTRTLTIRTGTYYYAGTYNESSGTASFPAGGYEERTVLAENTQVLEYGKNLTDITIEHTMPAATVFYVNATGYSGDDLNVSDSNGPLLFLYNGERQNAVTLWPNFPTDKPKYGYTYKQVDVGQMIYDGAEGAVYAYCAGVKKCVFAQKSKCVKASGVDMAYIDGSEEAFSPYKLVRVLSRKHEIDAAYKVNTIEYDLLDTTQTTVSVGTTESLITR